MRVTLGIDIGTGSTKAALVDGDGRLLSVGRSPHRPSVPGPGRSEMDPATWLAAAREAVGQAVNQVEAPVERPVEVAAIGFSGQMHGVVLCGPDAEPLGPAVLWSDRRSEPDLAGLAERLGPELLGRLANPVVAGMAGPTLAALARSEPDRLAGVTSVLQPKDWLRARLTGELATDPSDASATLLWDAVADDWSSAAIEAVGADRRWFPDVIEAADRAGALRAEGAELLGLPAGTPVAVGAADTAAALVGTGVRPGETQVSTGTGGQVARLLDRPVVDPTRRTHLYRSASPDARWYAMAAIQNAGVAIDWALGLLDAGPDEVTAAMTGPRPTAESADGAEVVFLPYLTGERTPHLDPTLTGRWIGLRPGTGRAELIRSVFEGVAFALADGVEALRAVGHPIDRALLVGGGSVAPWWRQLLADSLGLPLTPVDAVDASVRGAGLLAWASIGEAPDGAGAVERLDPIRPTEEGTAALAPIRARFHRAGPGDPSGS